jgi:hypothetical protein
MASTRQKGSTVKYRGSLTSRALLPAVVAALLAALAATPAYAGADQAHAAAIPTPALT